MAYFLSKTALKLVNFMEAIIIAQAYGFTIRVRG